MHRSNSSVAGSPEVESFRVPVSRLGAIRRFEINLSCVQLVEQGLGLPQIDCVEAFCKPAIDGREEITGLLPFALIVPESRKAHCGPQLP